jgi:hypothetical protein
MIENDVLKDTNQVEHLKDAWKYTGADDLEFIKEQAIEFCKNQEIKKAISRHQYHCLRMVSMKK